MAVCQLRQSGLTDLFPSLRETAWVGVSGGSLVMVPNDGEEFVYGSPPTTGGDGALGVVDFAMFPHLDHEAMPDHSLARTERWRPGSRAQRRASRLLDERIARLGQPISAEARPTLGRALAARRRRRS